MIHHPEQINHQEQLFVIRKLEGGHPVAHPGGHPGHSPHPHTQSRSNATKPPHRSAIHSFFLLCSGTVLAEIGGKTYLIKERELVMIPAGQALTWMSFTPVSTRYPVWISKINRRRRLRTFLRFSCRTAVSMQAVRSIHPGFCGMNLPWQQDRRTRLPTCWIRRMQIMKHIRIM